MTPSLLSRLARSALELTRQTDPDAAAREIFAEFERKVEEWSTSTGAEASQHVREEFAAQLSAKWVALFLIDFFVKLPIA